MGLGSGQGCQAVCLTNKTSKKTMAVARPNPTVMEANIPGPPRQRVWGPAALSHLSPLTPAPGISLQGQESQNRRVPDVRAASLALGRAGMGGRSTGWALVLVFLAHQK